MRLSTLFLMLFTLIAFAANSILCRQALMTDSIGPLEFTSIRLGSGILVLLPIILFRKRLFSRLSEDRNPIIVRSSNIWPAVALFSYAIFFSLAYIQLDAGTGALILFASVQITMIGISIARGNKVSLIEWAGLVISLSGLIYLLLPGLAAPPALGTILMIVSGGSWGIYSLLGQNQTQPILTTARNFLFSLPGVIFLVFLSTADFALTGQSKMSLDGILLAMVSGAITSGMGYVLWYLTVRRISTVVASICQLAVPILAALGGILFLSESLSLRLVIASILIVGGIVVTIVYRKSGQTPSQLKSN